MKRLLARLRTARARSRFVGGDEPSATSRGGEDRGISCQGKEKRFPSAERCTSAWDLCVVQDSIPAELGNVWRMLVDVSCFWGTPYDLTLVAKVSFVCVSCEQALFIRTVRTGFPLTISHELPILGMRAAVMPGISKGSWVPTCHRHIACFPLTSSHLLPTPGYNAVRLELGARQKPSLLLVP